MTQKNNWKKESNTLKTASTGRGSGVIGAQWFELVTSWNSIKKRLKNWNTVPSRLLQKTLRNTGRQPLSPATLSATGSVHQHGFTLLEIVAVLVVLGILAVGAASMVSSRTDELYIERDKLAARLVYARAKAMEFGGGVCLQLTPTKSALTASIQGTETTLVLPGETSPQPLPDGISAESITVCFDSLGRVCPRTTMIADTAAILTCPSDFSTSVLALSLSEGSTKATLYLYPTTGFTELP